MNFQETPQSESTVSGGHAESHPTTESEACDTSMAPPSDTTDCSEALLAPSSEATSPEAAAPYPAGESADQTGASAPPQEQPPVRLNRAEAARRNGAKSRGPCTEQGKERSRGNSVKHGLAARTLLRVLAAETLGDSLHQANWEECNRQLILHLFRDNIAQREPEIRRLLESGQFPRGHEQR